MTRKLKFRHVYRHDNGNIKFLMLDLDNLKNDLPDVIGHNWQHDWTLISRDQFTGLTDSEGREVYENDIVSFDDLEIGGTRYEHCEIIWTTDTTVVQSPGFYLWVKDTGVADLGLGVVKIIGNIHEGEL